MSVSRPIRGLLLVLTIMVSGGFRISEAANEFTFSDLARRLYSMEWLAEAPREGERSGSWTSHDRVPSYDAASNRYRHWWAGDDSDGFVRQEGPDSIVAAE